MPELSQNEFRYSDFFQSLDTNFRLSALANEYQPEISRHSTLVDEGAWEDRVSTDDQDAQTLTAQSDASKISSVKKWCTKWFRDWWGLEIASILLSTLFIIIIVVMLLNVQGSQVRNWRLSISIDAVLSILAGLSKSCLLMPTAEALGQLKWVVFSEKERAYDFDIVDKASRGTLGSVALLARARGVTLASIGAAIVLLSVPLDLFYQQIINYPLVPVLDTTANATISRAIQYDPDPETQVRNGTEGLPLDTQMNSWLYPYWFKEGSSPGLLFDCPTGNCTYDPFYTLAVDYQCIDLPDLLEFGCKNTSAEWMSTVAFQGPGANPNVTSCGYYLQPRDGSVPQLMSGYEVDPNGSIGEVLASRFFSACDPWWNQCFFGNDTLSFENVKHPIVDFILASTPGGFEGAMKNHTPVVTECEVHWTVKKVQSRVDSGRLSEVALETMEFPSNLDYSWDLDDPNWYLPNFTLTLDDPHSFTNGTSTFGLNNMTARKVWQTWALLAPSTFTRPSPSNPVKSGPVVKINWLESDPPHLSIVKDPALPWDTPNNVSAHMADIVTAMNQVVRRNALSESKTHNVAVGKAYRYVVIVDVRWEWIAFPASIWCIAVIFLAATMLRSWSNKDNVGVYKNSSLPILLDREKQKSQDGVLGKDLTSIRKQAKTTEIQLP